MSSTIDTIRSLVLGASVVIASLTVTRTSLFGYRLGAETLDIEEAALRLAAAEQPAPATLAAVCHAQPRESLARRANTILRGIWRPGDGTFSFHQSLLAGGYGRIEIRYAAPVQRWNEETVAEWMGRAARALEGAGMVAAREGGKVVVMDRVESIGERMVAA